MKTVIIMDRIMDIRFELQYKAVSEFKCCLYLLQQ